jgi:arylsulfatase A-like enzyme
VATVTRVVQVLSAVLALAPLAAAQEPRGRPNVLFFLSDDQRSDLLGCAGHPVLRTPNLDRLAKGGVRFTNMFVTTPICAASRATILTGLVERTHKFTFRTPPISAQHCAASYPALLRAAGYRTGIIGKFGVVVPRDQQAKLFDFFKPLEQRPLLRRQPDGGTRHVDEVVGDLAVEFLRGQRPGQPFCLSVSFHSPHADDGRVEDLYPWPKSVDGWYDGARFGPPPHGGEDVFAALPEFLRKSLGKERWYWQFDTPAKYQKNLRAYFRMISGLDHEIGRVLDELRRLNLDRDTVVVFSSDNGYFLGERGLSGKWVHYEEALRVPLIVYDPRRPAAARGRTLSELVLNLDLAPTFLGLAGVKPPAAYQGRSLVPLVAGERVGDWRTDFFCEHLFDHPTIPKWEGVRDRRWVYARYFQQAPGYEFLHDLEADPHELKNLAADPKSADVLGRMRKRCDELRDGYGGPYSPERFPTVNPRGGPPPRPARPRRSPDRARS